MQFEVWLIAELKKLKAEAAETSLLHPTGRDAFEYGRVCGFSQALAQVLETVDRKLHERHSADDDED